MSWRELRTFIRHVPQDSAFGRSMLGEAADWHTTDHLLAHLNNQFAQANSARRIPDSKKIQPPKPKVAEPAATKTLGAAELDALFRG